MLLRQNFGRCHQRCLMTVADRQVGRCRRDHGLAAAHVTLHQPVHGSATPEIFHDLIDGPLLGTGKREGQQFQKRLQIQIVIGFGLFLGTAGPHQGKTCGKYEKFFENQPFFRHFRLGHGGRLMDGRVGPVRAQDAVGRAHLRWNDLRRRIADGQRLPHRFEHGGIGKAGRQRVNGQHPAGGNGLGIQRLKDRIGHAVADKIAGHRTVENIFMSVLQLLCYILIIKEGQI